MRNYLLAAAVSVSMTGLLLRCLVSTSTTTTTSNIDVGVVISAPFYPGPSDLKIETSPGHVVILTWPLSMTVFTIMTVLMNITEILALIIYTFSTKCPRYVLLLLCLPSTVQICEAVASLVLLGNYFAELAGPSVTSHTGTWSLIIIIILAVGNICCKIIKYLLDSVYKSQIYIFSY